MTSFCAASQRDQKLLRSPKPSAEMDSEPGLRGVLGAFPASPGLPSPWVKRPPPASPARTCRRRTQRLRRPRNSSRGVLPPSPRRRAGPAGVAPERALTFHGPSRGRAGARGRGERGARGDAGRPQGAPARPPRAAAGQGLGAGLMPEGPPPRRGSRGRSRGRAARSPLAAGEVWQRVPRPPLRPPAPRPPPRSLPRRHSLGPGPGRLPRYFQNGRGQASRCRRAGPAPRPADRTPAAALPEQRPPIVAPDALPTHPSGGGRPLSPGTTERWSLTLAPGLQANGWGRPLHASKLLFSI